MSLRTSTPREGRWYPNLAGIAEPQVEQALYRAFDYIHQLKASTVPVGGPIPVSSLVIGAGEAIPGGLASAINRGLRTGGAAPLNLNLLPGVPIDTKRLIGDAQNFSFDMVFSATDVDTVAWTAGTLTFADGTSYAIAANNTGNMSALTYIYFNATASITELQVTTIYATAAAEGNFILSTAVAGPAGQEAFFIPVVGVLGLNEDNLAVNSVTTNIIAANAVTAVKINVVTLDAISANVGEFTAGIITGLLYRTGTSGRRLEIFNASAPTLKFFNTAGSIVAEILESGSQLIVGTRIGADKLILRSENTNPVRFEINFTTHMDMLQTQCDLFQDLDMNTDNILNCGDIELDSISKDVSGSILISDPVSMTGDFLPATTSIYDLGSSSLRFERVFSVNLNISSGATLPAATTIGALSYTWPASESAGQQLQTNGSGTLTWAAAGSLKKLKNMVEKRLDPQEALAKLVATPVRSWRYKKGMGTQDFKTLYTGVMAKELPEVMHHESAVFSPTIGFGYLLLGVQALHKRIEELEAAID